MPIEHRPAFKCAEEPDKPVWSGLIEPKGNVRHFHGPDRFLECWGTISSIHADAQQVTTAVSFEDGLARGVLTNATCLGNSLIHFVTLQRKPPAEQKKDPKAWEGSPLCETQVRWLWTPQKGKDIIGRVICKQCHQRWRGMGSPVPYGAFVAAPVDSDGIKLPLAWKEVPAIGLESDKRGEDDAYDFHEVKRWQRGERFVRLCEIVYRESEDDEDGAPKSGRRTHSLHYGWIGQKDEETIQSGFEGCLKSALELMVLGGAPKGSARRGRRAESTETMWSSWKDEGHDEQYYRRV